MYFGADSVHLFSFFGEKGREEVGFRFLLLRVFVFAVLGEDCERDPE